MSTARIRLELEDAPSHGPDAIRRLLEFVAELKRAGLVVEISGDLDVRVWPMPLGDDDEPEP